MTSDIEEVLKKQQLVYEVLGETPYSFKHNGRQYSIGKPGDIILRDVLNTSLLEKHGTTSLENIVAITSYVDLYACHSLRDLGKLQYVYGFLDIRNTSITKLTQPFWHAKGASFYCDDNNNDDSTHTYNTFCKTMETYKKRLNKLNPHDLPRILAEAEYLWQKTLCEEILSTSRPHYDQQHL